jgi:hypothetical protein
MTDEYEHRGMYYTIEKNNLHVYNASSANYVMGKLEDWTKGALHFDGESTFGEILSNSKQQNLVANDLNMTTNNFIVEAYLKIPENHSNSTIVSKFSNGTGGYRLGIDANGRPVMEIRSDGSSTHEQTGSLAINDEKWHHILAEVTRTAGIKIYIDGVLSNGNTAGSMPQENVSLENNADFLVGKDYEGNFFNGTIDFLRISKGNLNDARTTIDELYQWQFDGPFLYDFAGNPPIGKRDAGALEAGEKLCDLEISPASLEFEAEGGSAEITITGPAEIELLEIEASYLTGDLSDNKLTINVPANPSIEPRTTVVEVFGCNETKQIHIKQEGQFTNIVEPHSVLNIYPNPVKDILEIEHNYPGTISIQIFNLSGHRVYNNPYISKRESIDLSGFKPGMYLLQTKNNEDVKMIKIVVN